jgi:hypothetical protein
MKVYWGSRGIDPCTEETNPVGKPSYYDALSFISVTRCYISLQCNAFVTERNRSDLSFCLGSVSRLITYFSQETTSNLLADKRAT